MAELERLLGSGVPGVQRLDGGQRGQLLAHVKAARRKQHQDLSDAMEGALSYVPALLRGPIRKIFGV